MLQSLTITEFMLVLWKLVQLVYEMVCILIEQCMCVFSHLVLVGVPVVQQACWDEERVVLMAVLAVIPAAVVADLRLPSGETNWTLTSWRENHWVSMYVYVCVFVCVVVKLGDWHHCRAWSHCSGGVDDQGKIMKWNCYISKIYVLKQAHTCLLMTFISLKIYLDPFSFVASSVIVNDLKWGVEG